MMEDRIPVSHWDQGARIHYEESSRGIVPLMCVLAAASVTAVGIAFHSLGRAEQAVEESRRIRTEARILEDDTKYIRAYLSARGMPIPANHEEAEEK